MLWRNLGLVRAIAASGLLTFTALGYTVAGEPAEPVPGADSSPETVKVLEGEKAGLLGVEIRGQGQEKVRVSIRNSSNRRLNVVLPPGLVASSATGQGAGGGAGGGFQSMGLGAAVNRSGGFGQFAGKPGDAGFRSVDAANPNGITVPVGQVVDVDVPAVCLNFGMPTPTARNKFKLVDVDDYSKDARVRKALRSLATLGTSHGTAQAAMWRICNNVPFDLMLAKGEKTVNPAEVALAARFIEALDNGSEMVDPAYLTEARVFVTLEGEGQAAKDAKRLNVAIDGLRILGLPSRVMAVGEAPKVDGPAIHVGVTLASLRTGETRGKVVVQSATGLAGEEWATLSQVSFIENASIGSIDGAAMARAIDRAVSGALVTTKVSKRSNGSTTLRVENRLPFTLSQVVLKGGVSAGSPLISLPGVGVGPGRSGLVTIPASNATVERVELNGL